MNKILAFDRLYGFLLSEKVKLKIEKIILIIAMVSFLVHLSLIYLKRYDLLDLFQESNFFDNPIAAIYTPFSFILVYEVYLLIFYLFSKLARFKKQNKHKKQSRRTEIVGFSCSYRLLHVRLWFYSFSE